MRVGSGVILFQLAGFLTSALADFYFAKHISLLRRSSNNLNQYAKRAHETGRIYEADIEDIQSSLKSVWEKADQIMTRLSTID